MWTLGDKLNILTPDRASKIVMKELERYEPFIYAKAQGHGSVYIHFRNLPNAITHKLRISTHEERKRYGYKWQLRLDGIPRDKKPQRRYFDTIDSLVADFKRYYARVESLNQELLQGVLDEQA